MTTELRRPGGWTATLSKGWSVFLITLQTNVAYVGELLVRSIFIVMILFIFTQLWRATGQSGKTGFSLTQLIWYLAFTEAIMTSADTGKGEVDREVRSGDIAYRLSRPLSYPIYQLSAALGQRVLRFTLNLLIGIAVTFVMVGPLQTGPAAFFFAVTAALLSFLADWVWTFTISLLSFWFEDTFGLHLLWRRALMILGGMLIPLEAYPAWLGDIARALPFQYLVYGPARLFVIPDLHAWLQVCGAIALLGIVGIIPLLAVYRLGLRQVSAQGG